MTNVRLTPQDAPPRDAGPHNAGLAIGGHVGPSRPSKAELR